MYKAKDVSTETFVDEKNLFDIEACYKAFTENGAKPLKTPGQIASILEGTHDPFAKNASDINPGIHVFASFAWDKFLESQFLSGKDPHESTLQLLYEFVPELSAYKGNELDRTLFTEFAKWINEPDQVKMICSSNYHDIPAILRLLGPTNDNLVQTIYNPLKWFFGIMKGLPHKTIMEPYYMYKLYNGMQHFKTANNVS